MSVPRVCGDEPMGEQLIPMDIRRSPRMRG